MTSPRPLVAVIEDSRKLGDALSRGLEEEGFAVAVSTLGAEGLERVLRGDVDLVILDLGLPDLDGTDVVARIRAAGLSVPLLVLTARDTVESRVDALDRGADDYLLKPFAFAELVARVRALLRRASAPRWAPLSFQGVSFIPSRTECWVAGEQVALSPKERALLELFLRQPGEVLSNRRILAEAFGYAFDPGTNIVAVHVGHLRKKLVGGGVSLEAVRGAGYRLVVSR